MSNKDIKEKTGIDYVLNKQFRNLPAHERRKGVVLNLDQAGPGTHWVAIREKVPGVYEYFDSFGAPPESNVAKNVLLLYNGKKMQKFREENCGKRATDFLLNKK